MAKTVRLADIAEKVGVSVVTVSKAIRGKDGVSEELRTQILSLAEEMGYEAKSSAENETEHDSYIIGILTSYRYLERGSSFYWSLYERLLTQLSVNGDFGFLEVISAEDEEKISVPRIVQERHADGLIVMGKLEDDYIKMLNTLHVPFTMLDSYQVRYPYDTVISDGYYGMCAMTDYLIEMGHKKIFFIGTIGETSSITDRYFGYCRAMTEAGIPVTNDMLLPDRNAEGKIEISLPEDIAERATALVCNCDFTAYAVFQKLTAMGIRVPEDISLVGFDNYILSEMSSVKITTYAVNQDGMAEVSAQQIRERIKNPDSKQRIQTIGGEIMLRESVKKLSETAFAK